MEIFRQQQYSAGKPSKHDKTKLMRSEGIIPIQAGSNKYASQKGMTVKGSAKLLYEVGLSSYRNLFKILHQTPAANCVISCIKSTRNSSTITGMYD
ncbi:calponin family repeat-containing domain protein [Oesophagostomum dentatum]|uniref:Calponin family repeat-containing domain protein n=1 Tax=Oesophagostomum dentatum TaxID=61180 RepID=A0A0B1SLI0_OESDE|nr:calponin family repeat-containing domain protein [Oesophagostomum dentatum]